MTIHSWTVVFKSTAFGKAARSAIVSAVFSGLALCPALTAQQTPKSTSPATSSKHAEKQHFTVRIVNRREGYTDYSYILPGEFVSTAQSRGVSSANCQSTTSGYNTTANCTGIGSSTTTTAGAVTPPQQLIFHVRGATLALALPDARLVVVNCAAHETNAGVGILTALLSSRAYMQYSHESCRVPLGNTAEADFRGSRVKLQWNVSLDGLKTESETYEILGVFTNPSGKISPHDFGSDEAAPPESPTGQMEQWRKAAEKGDADAEVHLGVAYYTGQSVPQDYTEAVKWWSRAAEQGNVKAEAILGAVYFTGRGVPQDDRNAMKWWRKAAQQGDPNAESLLGDAYSLGRGVPRDYTEALRWWRKAAGQGNAGAENQLGLAYANGHGVSKDYAQAADWYRKAAEQGNQYAAFNLGVAYAKGLGLQQNMNKATKWWRDAAERGYSNAEFNLGFAYANGEGSLPQNYAEAYFWLDLAASRDMRPHATEVESKMRDSAASHLTPSELDQVQERARKWAEAHPAQ